MQALRQLVFGAVDGTFSNEWRAAYFQYSDVHGLEHALVQAKVFSEVFKLIVAITSFQQPGPSGVIAAVQASVLKHLLFDPSHPQSM